jgi:hypothetical protein
MSGSEVILYQTPDGLARVECRFEEERVWLTQAQMATLNQTTLQNITQHLRARYAEGERQAEATCKEDLQVRTEGRRAISRPLLHCDIAAVDAQVKANHDKPTIGLLRRGRPHRLVAEHARSGKRHPVNLTCALILLDGTDFSKVESTASYPTVLGTWKDAWYGRTSDFNWDFQRIEGKKP